MLAQEASDPQTKTYIPWDCILSAEEYKHLGRQKGLTHKRRLTQQRNFVWHIGPAEPVATEEVKIPQEEDISGDLPNAPQRLRHPEDGGPRRHAEIPPEADRLLASGRVRLGASPVVL